MLNRNKLILKIGLTVIGTISLVWFLIRVIPKPSRAAYPCQRAAFPLASALVIWIISAISASYFYKKAKTNLVLSKYGLMAVFAVLSAGFWVVTFLPSSTLNASVFNTKEQFVPTDAPNTPVGEGKGIFPGRVVWNYNPNATNWTGETSSSGTDGTSGATSTPTSGDWYLDEHIIQAQVDSMVSESIRKLTGENTDQNSWNAAFVYFNKNHDKGEVGYKAGEKIAIKINLNTSNGHGDMGSTTNASPQMVFSLLKQLVNHAGIAPENITFYDISRDIPAQIYDKCKATFPKVNFVDKNGGAGRIKVVIDTKQIYWSQPLVLEDGGGNATYLPKCVTDANYIISFSNLKAHNWAGVTMCAKNFFGSFSSQSSKYPGNSSPQAAGVHAYTKVHKTSFWTDMAARKIDTYNPLVDLLGHKDLGNKCLMFLIDALYAAPNQGSELDASCKWESAPFNGNWTSSFFASFDDVALESVGVDLLRTEQAASASMIEVWGPIDNYLHEAAQADNPPSKTVYDPEKDGIRLKSLGVHEHWNNSTDKQYSRNLGFNKGIELIPIIHQWGETSNSEIALKDGLNKLEIFPNPASDRVYIKISSISNGSGKLEIFTMNGQLLTSQAFTKRSDVFESQMNIGQWKGILLLRASIGSKSYSTKIFRK